MPSEAFIIREITGSQRSVELRNRALPYQAIQYQGTQHYTQTWYPGNPNATIQVLGPQEGDLPIRGMWKTRYIGNDVTTEGFDDVIQNSESMTAEILTQIFHRLRRSGNLVEIRWGPEVRRGIIKEFTPDYDRVEDIRWTIIFAISQIGDRPAPRAADTRQPDSEVESAQNDLDEAAADIPDYILPNTSLPILSEVLLMRGASVSLITTLNSIYGVPSVPSPIQKDVEAIVKRIMTSGRAITDRCSNGPYIPFIATDRVDRVFGAEVWRQSVSGAARGVMAAAIRARENVRRRAVPGILAIVKIRQNQTLRTLARIYYRDSDNWRPIANANGFATPIVDSGTTVVIPYPPQTGSGVRLTP